MLAHAGARDCEVNMPPDPEIIDFMDGKVQEAQAKLVEDVQDLGKEIQLPPPFLYQGQYVIECNLAHDPQKYDAYWYHTDHLGSSNYITNFIGNISQHTCPERSRRMEYFL